MMLSVELAVPVCRAGLVREVAHLSASLLLVEANFGPFTVLSRGACSVVEEGHWVGWQAGEGHY